MKQTAVEFLEKEIIEIMSYLEEDGAYAMQGVKDKIFGEKNIIQQAKEMEKEQIIKARLSLDKSDNIWDKEIEQLKIKHEQIREILIKYDCEEYGDCIIDEICNVIKIPPTTIYYQEN